MHLPCHVFGKHLHCKNVDTIYLPWEDKILLRYYIKLLELDIFFREFHLYNHDHNFVCFLEGLQNDRYQFDPFVLSLCFYSYSQFGHDNEDC